MRQTTPVITLKGITKQYPGVLANDHIDLELFPGEILGLLGENGAGKTTLMEILYGLIEADDGEIYVSGNLVQFRSSSDAIKHGLGMVHQHFMLVPSYSVAQNMILGQPSRRAPFTEDLKQVADRISELSQRYNLQVDPQREVSHLSVGEQQRVEILKLLYRGARTLILDEPTGVLTPQETEELLKILRSLAEDGCSVIFISHKLNEVMAVCDRIAVLRNGRLVGVVNKTSTSSNALAEMMVGRKVLLQIHKEKTAPGDVLLSIQNLWVHDDRNLAALRGFTLDVHDKEIVGIAGVDGNGQRELEEAICGIRQVSEGAITLCGKEVTNRSTSEIIQAGLGHIPSDRYAMGFLQDFNIAENLILKTFRSAPFSRVGFLDETAVAENARSLIEQRDIRVTSARAHARTLSGGNVQKMIFARELSMRPKVMLAAQPTRGLDIGATEFLRQALVKQAEGGMAILLISTELEEILALSDRIIVIYEGRVMGECLTKDANIQELGLMMAGSQP